MLVKFDEVVDLISEQISPIYSGKAKIILSRRAAFA
jgi:hypothetical protein